MQINIFCSEMIGRENKINPLIINVWDFSIKAALKNRLKSKQKSLNFI